MTNRIVVIDETLCTGCRACVETCPQKILYIDEEEGVCRVTDETQCDKLRGCEQVCPTDAIKIH
ncbi:ferredoxin family protein [Candidatus Bipolaricaulota bacterium]